MNIKGKKYCFSECFDYLELKKALDVLLTRYTFLDVGSIGSSIFGRTIPRITLGRGKKSVIYIGAHHGMEWITSALLIKFIEDYCEEYQNGAHIFDVSTRVLFETRRIHIIPMLNPDGVDYSLHSLSDNNIIKNRVIAMNGGSSELTHWQANARGVDLNHNYASGFSEYKSIEKELGLYKGAPTKYSGEYPESEPEVRALCNFVRFEAPELALSLHTQGEELYYTSGEHSAPNSLPIVKTVSRLTGYKIALPQGSAKYGGFTDWFIDEFDKPSITLECGKGENPLPFSELDSIYVRIKRALFTAPILI